MIYWVFWPIVLAQIGLKCLMNLGQSPLEYFRRFAYIPNNANVASEGPTLL